MTSQQRLPYVYGFACAMLFGSSAPVAKLLLTGIEPVMLASLLYFGSGAGLVVLMCIASVFGRDRTHVEAAIRRKDLPWIGGIILFGGVIAPVALMLSLRSTPATTAALLLNFEAVATTVIAGLMFREFIGHRIWTALGLITLSCLILSWDPASMYGISLAALGILIATIFWALDNNISRQLSSRDPLPIVTVKGIGAGVISLVLALALGEQIPALPTVAVAMALGFLSYGGIVSVLFLLALRGMGTARTGACLAFSPFFGVAASFLLFTEPPGTLFFISVPVMALGALLLVTEKHGHSHIHSQEVHEHRHRHDDGHHDHDHMEAFPPLNRRGEHSHLHTHTELVHAHPHSPDLHHRHGHERTGWAVRMRESTILKRSR